MPETIEVAENAAATSEPAENLNVLAWLAEMHLAVGEFGGA